MTVQNNILATSTFTCIYVPGAAINAMMLSISGHDEFSLAYSKIDFSLYCFALL